MPNWLQQLWCLLNGHNFDAMHATDEGIVYTCDCGAETKWKDD